jgi:hypothetical protein
MQPGFDTTKPHSARVYDYYLGGCDQPAAACEVHHLTEKADGGKTSVQDCALFCWFHHHVEAYPKLSLKKYSPTAAR